jgi:hypothetical protein
MKKGGGFIALIALGAVIIMVLSLTSLSAYTNAYIVPKAFNVVYMKSPLFIRAMTKNNFRFEGGKFIQQPIVPFKLLGSSFGPGSRFSTAWVNTETAYQVNIKFYMVSVVLLGTDGVLNMGNEAALSQVELKMSNASAKMGEMLAVDSFLAGLSNANVITNLGQDSDTLSLDGFAQWVDDGNNVTTVGGITRTDIGTTGVVGGGNGYYKAVGGTMLLTDLNRAIATTTFTPDRVDLIVGTPLTCMVIQDLLQGNQRFLREDTDMAKAGLKGIEYMGALVVPDNYAPAGALLGICSDYFMFYISTNPLFQFGFTGFKEDQGTIDYAGQFLYAGNIVYPNPRTGFYMVTISFS